MKLIRYVMIVIALMKVCPNALQKAEMKFDMRTTEQINYMILKKSNQLSSYHALFIRMVLQGPKR